MFNKSKLLLEVNSNKVILAQKPDGHTFYMNTIIEGKDHDWFLSKEQAEKLYQHLGGMLGK